MKHGKTPTACKSKAGNLRSQVCEESGSNVECRNTMPAVTAENEDFQNGLESTRSQVPVAFVSELLGNAALYLLKMKKRTRFDNLNRDLLCRVPLITWSHSTSVRLGATARSSTCFSVRNRPLVAHIRSARFCLQP